LFLRRRCSVDTGVRAVSLRGLYRRAQREQRPSARWFYRRQRRERRGGRGVLLGRVDGGRGCFRRTTRSRSWLPGEGVSVVLEIRGPDSWRWSGSAISAASYEK